MNVLHALNNFDSFASGDFEIKAQKLFQLQLQLYPNLALFHQHVSGNQDLTFSFFPVMVFKHLKLCPPNVDVKYIFESSGTTGTETARHFISDAGLYQHASLNAFKHFYNSIPHQQPLILALLPSYIERGNASLVHMVKNWMDDFGAEGSDFFLNDFERLSNFIQKAIHSNSPILLIGVTYALLDFFEEYPMQLHEQCLLIETGGMKGRRTELLRSEVHLRLKQLTGLPYIHSEYGMTELMSQAYSQDKGIFRCPPWMQVYIREVNDISRPVHTGKTGRICIIDLANKWSCAFIATDDIGRMFEDGTFEVLGRADTAGLRGCSLMYAE